jgi:hypothetical protein
MELLNGPEFKDMRSICQETMAVFGKWFMESAKCELFVSAVEGHRQEIALGLKPSPLNIPPRNGRQIAPSRLSSSIPPHIHDDNHTYEQDPAAKLSASIVGWREVKALTHYGVYVVEVVCSDGRPPKWIYKRFREFERLFSSYGKLVSSNTKVKLPSTSSSSPAMGRDGPGGSATSGGTAKSRSKASNKFDPSFHTQRAKELQPFLTALCERSDVFGLTKFMRWLFFEKKRDIPLQGIFQKALQRTLDFYNITQPVYANNMIDALTWLMFLRISHLWDKVRKGIHFWAVRAVQDLILKAIRPLDDMILELNSMAAHMHQILQSHPPHFLKPKECVDSMVEYAFKTTFSAYEAPMASMLGLVFSELSDPLKLIGKLILEKFEKISKLAYTNIFNDGDELSVTALVTETDALFELCRSQLLPQVAQAVTSLHQTLNGKFNSPAMQASFMALAEIAPVIPRLLDAMLPQQAILDFFLRILKMRHATEALELSLDAKNLSALLNELETETEREIEKIEILLSLKARSLHATVRRLHTACFPLAAPLGECLLQYAAMWGKYMRKFTRVASDLLAAQQLCHVPISWSISARDCLVLALQQANDYLAVKSRKIARTLLQTTLVALFQPLTLSLYNQISNNILPNVTQQLSTYTVPAPPSLIVPPPSGLVTDIPFSNIVEPLPYMLSAVESLFSDAIGKALNTIIFEPLYETWINNLTTSNNEDDKNQRERLEFLYQRLLSEMQKLEMDDEMRRDSFLDDKRTTVAGAMMPSMRIPSMVVNGTTTPNSTKAGLVTADAPRKASVAHPVSYSESPVAKLIGRLTIEGDSGDPVFNGSTTQQLNDKKLSKDLTMLSRISEHGGAKAHGAESDDLRSTTDTPALIFDFEVQDTQLNDSISTASGVWAAAAATQALYRGRLNSRRVFYEIHEDKLAEATPSENSKLSPPVPRSTYKPGANDQSGRNDANSPARVVPRKPTLGVRPSRGSNASSSSASTSSNPHSSTASVGGGASPSMTPGKQRGPSIAISSSGASSPVRDISPSTSASSLHSSHSSESLAQATSDCPKPGDSSTSTSNGVQSRWTSSYKPSQIISCAEVRADPNAVARSTSPPSENGAASSCSPVVSAPISAPETDLSPTSTSVKEPQDSSISTTTAAQATPQFTMPGASIRIRPRQKP